jgi:hypothetical protein
MKSLLLGSVCALAFNANAIAATTDSVSINFSEDAYQGNAIADVLIDNIKEPAYTVTAIHSSGQTQTVNYSVPSAASHTIKIYFPNDAWGGSPTKDRNLYAQVVSSTAVVLSGDSGNVNNMVIFRKTGDSAVFTVPGNVIPPAPPPVASDCQTMSSLPDGCSAAPQANANAYQNPTLLASYKARPNWNVAGVDYPVGIPKGVTLTDWWNINVPGVSVDKTSGMIRIFQDNVVLKNIDFSLHNGFSQIYITANSPTITQSKFGGANEAAVQSGLIYQVNGYGGSPVFTYNWVDGGNNPPSPKGEMTFLTAFSGNITLEYNYFVNYPAQIINVQNGTSYLVYKYNFIGPGSIAQGAHENWMQWSCNCTVTADVEFNTGLQTRTGLNNWTGGGLIWQFAEGNPGPLSATAVNPVFSYNTMIASGPASGPANNTVAVANFIAGEVGSQSTSLTGTGQAKNNYFDLTDAYGAFYSPTSLEKWTVSGNIDMVSGNTITPTDQ